MVLPAVASGMWTPPAAPGAGRPRVTVQVVTDDDLSPGERYVIAALRKDMRAGFADINRRIDGLVTAQVFELHKQLEDLRHAAHDKGLAELAAARQKDKDEYDATRKEEKAERVKDRRWRIRTALAAAGGMGIVFQLLDLVRATI